MIPLPIRGVDLRHYFSPTEEADSTDRLDARKQDAAPKKQDEIYIPKTRGKCRKCRKPIAQCGC
jgi:hypothetical protein